MEHTRLIELISKKLSADISNQENSELAKLLENPNNQAVFDDLESKWKSAGKLKIKHDANTEKSWVGFQAKVDRPTAKEAKMIPMFYKVAAALIVGIGLGYFHFQNTTANKIEYFTKSGEILKITLPDSSNIWLNESSYLSYDESFNTAKRQVSLKGEAFFEVEKNPNKPFIVHGHQSKTEVLGTSFNISAYDSLSFVEIDVNSGKVAFSEIGSSDNGVLLTKGESAKLNLSTLALNKVSNQNPNYSSWKTKKLVFEDADLQNVVKDLNHYFDIKIQIGSEKINSCKLTSTFSEPSLDEILEVIQIALDVSATKSDQGYVLSGQGCQ